MIKQIVIATARRENKHNIEYTLTDIEIIFPSEVRIIIFSNLATNFFNFHSDNVIVIGFGNGVILHTKEASYSTNKISFKSIGT